MIWKGFNWFSELIKKSKLWLKKQSQKNHKIDIRIINKYTNVNKINNKIGSNKNT